MRKKQVERFLDYSESLPAKSVNQWTKDVLDWEEDSSKPNPFIYPSGRCMLKFLIIRLMIPYSYYRTFNPF